MVIGIPRQSKQGETLVAATAKTVSQLTKPGYEIVVEAGTGDLADQPDSAFTNRAESRALGCVHQDGCSYGCQAVSARGWELDCCSRSVSHRE